MLTASIPFQGAPGAFIIGPSVAYLSSKWNALRDANNLGASDLFPDFGIIVDHHSGEALWVMSYNGLIWNADAFSVKGGDWMHAPCAIPNAIPNARREHTPDSFDTFFLRTCGISA